MSSPSYSFVIPVLNEARGLRALLPRLRAQFPAAELLLVDGGSDDGSVAVAMPRCDRLLLSPPGRAKQMNLGARAARGDYLLFLHADTVPLFDEALLATWLAARPQWGFCRVRLSGRAPALRLIEGAMNLRSRLTRVATGDQLLMVRRDAFLARGAFAEIPLMEDVEVCKRLRVDSAPRPFAGTVLTSSRRWEEGGVVSTVLRMWGLRLAYVCGVSPQRLWRYYYGG
ncbi:TIGR04283 family arsenosugar biosynthesis glycosyltransferase [Parahaliea mediterranea]|uniref:TIGR04283 family arsenosugar biosynthesis glycosyltransferase n=1 Tax=Parahaliea mediterranea TaxID=651086 RepID=A0A939DGT5_9GAMM|nr:TIGR04283 family arsenosugar biosynthesis glycosyltransferase [Parahaliea mediterranea]